MMMMKTVLKIWHNDDESPRTVVCVEDNYEDWPPKVTLEGCEHGTEFLSRALTAIGYAIEA